MRKQARKTNATPDGSEIEHIWRSRPIDFNLIAVDPGDRWTGVAFFKQFDDGWDCVDAVEFSPAEFEDALAETLLLDPSGLPDELTIIYERWRLYADHAQEKVGSEFLASQHIGVIKYITRVHNEHAERHQDAERRGKMMTCELPGGKCGDATRPMPVVEILDQVADIKKPTRGILNKKGIRSVAGPIAKAEYGNRDHVKDAELHGWYRIMNKWKQEPRPAAFK